MKPGPTFRKGWNRGLRTAVQALIDARVLNSPEEVLQVSQVLQPLLLAVPRFRPPDRETAKKYGISKRTVLNWRKDGCPFHKGKRAVVAWMIGRRYLPALTEKKFRSQLSRQRLQDSLLELDNHVVEVQALAKVHRELGLPVEPWMKMKRLTRRKAALLVERAKQEIRRSLAGVE